MTTEAALNLIAAHWHAAFSGTPADERRAINALCVALSGAIPTADQIREFIDADWRDPGEPSALGVPADGVQTVWGRMPIGSGEGAR